MADINETFEIMIAEMQRYGATPAPSKGGSYNNLLQYRETRDKIIDRFLAAFAEGYRLGKEDVEEEPLTIEQLRQMDGEPVWVEEVKHWALIDIEKGGQWDGIPFAVWAENGTKFTYNVESRDLHCYRRPPEGEEKTR